MVFESQDKGNVNLIELANVEWHGQCFGDFANPKVSDFESFISGVKWSSSNEGSTCQSPRVTAKSASQSHQSSIHIIWTHRFPMLPHLSPTLGKHWRVPTRLLLPPTTSFPLPTLPQPAGDEPVQRKRRHIDGCVGGKGQNDCIGSDRQMCGRVRL
jgi:hypothetical protein